MKYPALRVHTATVIGATVFAGAALFYGVGTLGLRGKLPEAGTEGLMVVLLVFLLLGAAWAIRRRISYGILLPVFGVSAPLVAYLAYDDPSRPAAPELGRIAAADSKNFIAYRSLVRNGANSQAAALPKRPELPPVATGQKSEWLELANQHRAAVDAAWAADEFGRKWIDAMAETAPDGIYPPFGQALNVLDFQAARHIAQTRWAYAQLLMHDRRGDEAARVLLPQLRAHYHLQRGAATLVEQMIAVVVLKGTYQRLEMLADSGNLSPEVRASVANALREAPELPDTFRNAFLGEQMFARHYVEDMTWDAARAVKSVASKDGARLPAIPVLSRLFYNPHRSEREYVEFLNEVCQLAQQRQLAAADEKMRQMSARLGRQSFKNPVGKMLMEMSLPAFSKTCEAAWAMEDQRVALLQRLGAG
jgi:hypothetical protein